MQITLMIVNHPDILYTATQKAAVQSRGLNPMEDANQNQENSVKITLNGPKPNLFEEDEIAILESIWRPGDHRYSWAESLLLRCNEDGDPEYCTNAIETSGKMVVLVELLEGSRARNERVSIFSQSIATLDVIEQLLSKVHSKFGRYITLRIDGSISLPLRFERIKVFLQKTTNGGGVILLAKQQNLFFFFFFVFVRIRRYFFFFFENDLSLNFSSFCPFI